MIMRYYLRILGLIYFLLFSLVWESSLKGRSTHFIVNWFWLELGFGSLNMKNCCHDWWHLLVNIAVFSNNQQIIIWLLDAHDESVMREWSNSRGQEVDHTTSSQSFSIIHSQRLPSQMHCSQLFYLKNK